MFDLTLRPQSMPHRLRVKISSGLAIVFSTYIVTTALIILHLRSWDTIILKQIAVFSSYPLMLFGLVSIALFLIRTPWIYRGILPIATLLFMGMPFVFNQLGLWVVLSLAVLGIILITFSAWLTYGKAIWSNLPWLLCSGIVIATFYVGAVNGTNTVNLLPFAHIFSDVASYIDYLHHDTLFHSSIINMLANFSIPSTGLNGLPAFTYHDAVHRWFASFQVLVPGNTPLLLAIGIQIGLLPVLFFTWVLTIGLLLQGSINLLSLMVWAFGSLIVSRWFLWEDFYLVIESWTFSLPVFLAMIPIAQSWFLPDSSNGRSERFWSLILVSVALIASSRAKVSTGVILLIFLIACFILPRLMKTDRRSLFVYGGLGLLLSVIGVYLAYFFIGRDAIFQFSPFEYVKAFPKIFITQCQFAMLCLWFFYAWGKQTSSDPWKHQILTLALAITFAASLLPGLVLDINPGASNYFIFAAELILLLFGLVGLINQWNKLDRKAYLSRLWPQPWSKTIVGSWLVAFIVITQLLIILVDFYIPRYLSFVDQSTRYLSLFDQSHPVASAPDLRRAMVSPTGNHRLRHRLKYLWTPPAIDLARLQSVSALYRIKQAVDSAGIDPTAANTMVYISPDFDEFWSQEKDIMSRNCWVKPFHIPAVLGIPLLNGVRDEVNNCDNTPYFAMANYDSDSWNIVLSDKAACDRAKNLGFSRVFMIHQDHQRLLSCPNQ